MIRILHDRHAWPAIRPDWERLQRNSGLFQRYDLALLWWRAFGKGKSLAIIHVRQPRGEAILPLYRDEKDDESCLRVLGAGACDQLDLLAQGEIPHAGLTRALQLLGCSRLQVDAALPHARITALSGLLDCPVSRSDFSAMPLLHTARLDLARLRDAHPRSCYRHRRILREGAIIRELQDPIEAQQVLREAFQLKRANLHEEEKCDIFADGCHQRWLAALIRRHLGGLVRLRTLTIEGQLVAAVLYFAQARAWNLYFTVYDKDFARLSPGVALLWDILESAASSGIPLVNFLTGEQWYKLRWHDDTQALIRLDADLTSLGTPLPAQA
ncbi:GNAT family N-acetyltransferase [Thermithiobacillus plumbiphilus]|uniref:GNAT family N-acetyltransferase n=1 Tax=Thermithiobacillus plumbiphilus TaxID=1729899 RepID=A0ABU9D9X9_9PROT